MSSCWESCTVERDGCNNPRQAIIRSEGNQREHPIITLKLPGSSGTCRLNSWWTNWLWESQDTQVSFTSKMEIHVDISYAPQINCLKQSRDLCRYWSAPPIKCLLNMPTAQDPIMWRPWIRSPMLEVRMKMLSAAHLQKIWIPAHQYGNPK